MKFFFCLLVMLFAAIVGARRLLEEDYGWAIWCGCTAVIWCLLAWLEVRKTSGEDQ